MNKSDNFEQRPSVPDTAKASAEVGYGLSPAENDTYDALARREKEHLDDTEVRAHWRVRAQRPGVQSVMSARHSLEDNERATIDLQREIFDFAAEEINNKKVFELGVGIGRMTAELAKRAENVTGIDMTPEMLERAKANLTEYKNVALQLGKITDIDLPPQSFDTAFESIVLLHITNPEELRATIDKLKELANTVVIIEHTFDPTQPDLSGSKFSIFRDPKEYEELFKPYELVKQKDVRCVTDRFTMMMFKKP